MVSLLALKTQKGQEFDSWEHEEAVKRPNFPSWIVAGCANKILFAKNNNSKKNKVTSIIVLVWDQATDPSIPRLLYPTSTNI